MQENSFPYSYWAKLLGLVIIVAGIGSFFLQYFRKGILDYNEIAIGFSWGLVFIFFSKEKTDDEMMQGLKFKALTRVGNLIGNTIRSFLFPSINLWHLR